MSRSNDHRYDVVVIGAGHNGLAAAGVLANSGRKVLVVERCAHVGGLAVGDEFHPGYRSAGLLHETLGLSGELVDTLGLEAHGLVMGDGPAVFAPQVEGAGVLLPHNHGDAFKEIAALSQPDAERYGEYRAFIARIAKFTRKVLLDGPPDVSAEGIAGLWSLASSGLALRRLGEKDMLELMRIVPMCVADWLGEWFETELIRCALAHTAVAGSFAGPRSPGTNAVLIRNETLGGRAARGGAAAVIDALASAARALGVEIRTSATVERISVSDDSVTGVTLVDGETIGAPVVAASCDPKRALLGLIGAGDVSEKLARAIGAFRTDGVTAKVDLALRRPMRFACRPSLDVTHARTAETMNEIERAFDAVKYGRFSDRPILDIYVPTMDCQDWAPSGHSVVSIIAHYAPYALKGGWSDVERERLGDVVVDALARYAPDVRDHIVARRVLTPVDIERRYGMSGGHIHHGEQGLDQLLVRPCLDCARYATPIRGLYLCGSGAHPGGGVMGAGGRNAAGRVLAHRTS